MRFKKIKVTSKGKVRLDYELKVEDSYDEISFTKSDKAKPSFHVALQALVEDVVDMCEMPGFADRIIVTGVSFSYAGENEVMGVTLTGQMHLERSMVQLNLNTPYKIEEYYAEDGDPKSLLSKGCLSRLKTLASEAEDYVRGLRAQTELFTGG
jgi:hypothetical protein